MSGCSSLSDEKLVSLCKTFNDEKAWNELSSRYLLVAKKVSAAFSGSVLEREDLIQEGIFGFLTAVCSYDQESGTSFSTYAAVCIKNRMLSALKARNAQKQIPPSLFVPIEDESETADNSLSPEEFLVSKNEASRIAALISSELSESERKVFSLYLCGKSYREIGKETALSVKAVDSSLQRARKKLKKALG